MRITLRAWVVALLALTLTPVVRAVQSQPVSVMQRDLRGGDTIRIGNGQPTVVAVFATWCRSCKDEVATFNALSKEFGARGVRVVALSADEGSEERLLKWLENYKVMYPVIRDTTGATLRALGVVGVPEVYVVDAKGRIVWSRRGPIDSRLEDLRRAVYRTNP
jgi:peroxiredoxin